MKYINIIVASLGFVLTCSHSDWLMAATGTPPSTLTFAVDKGLELQKYSIIEVNRSLLTKKMTVLSNRPIIGKANHRSNNNPFIAPGVNSGFLQAANHFGQ
jgi:hypothetical protein